MLARRKTLILTLSKDAQFLIPISRTMRSVRGIAAPLLHRVYPTFRLTCTQYFHNFGTMKSKQAIDALAALAQETRLAIFRLLVRQCPQGLPAGAIAEQLEIPAPTMSFHLAQLSRAGLVTSRREGRSILYAANSRGMNALLTYLTEDCCGGRPEICGTAACGSVSEPLAALTGDHDEALARIRRR